jgi:hypothetical protein
MNQIQINIKSKGCVACPLYNPNDYCVDNVTCCPYLLERDFFAKRISEEEYKKEVKVKSTRE